MVSNTVSKVPLPDPQAAMVERDRRLAMHFVLQGEPKGGVSQMARDLNVDRKVLARAIERQAAWARETIQANKKAPESPEA